MNNKKEIKRFRLCAGLCLLMLLFFQGDILSFSTVKASNLVRTVESGSVLLEKYACSFQVTDETRTETLGIDNAMRNDIDPEGIRAIEAQEIKNRSQKGKAGILYTNAGFYKGKIFDLKITLTDWGKINKDKAGKNIKPGICFYTDKLTISLYAVEKAMFSFEFLEHGTNEKMQIKGHFTLTDKNKEYSSTMLFDGGFTLELEAGKTEMAEFSLTPNKDGVSEISTDFHQKVGAPECPWEEAVKTKEDKPYEFCEYDTFEYQFRHRLSPNRLDEYEMQTTLDACLAVYGKEDVRVTDAFGKNVTGRFRIAIDGQTIVCRAKEEELKKAGFINGETYTFHVEVHRKRGAEIEEEHFQRTTDGFTFQIPVTAELSWVTADGEKKSVASGTAWVQSRMLSELIVEQTADYEWKPGDIVDFTVLVRQTSVNARAVNVKVENPALPQGLKLIGNATASGAPDVNLKNMEKGWTLSCPSLDYDQVIAVVFQCRVEEGAAGQELLNTVTATADNYLDISENVKRVASDAQDVWVNSAAVMTRSSLNRESWKEGDEVICRLTVFNPAENTVAVDTEVLDSVLPEGLKLTEVAGTAFDKSMDVVMYPVSDKRTGLLRRARENFWNVFTEGDSWKVKIDYLTSQNPLQLDLKCTATADSVESVTTVDPEVLEETTAEEENTGQWIEDESDSEKTAMLVINHAIHNRNLKENDNRLNNEFRVGETVDYKITVENRNTDTPAKNLVISNTSLPAGLQLQGSAEDVVWEGAEGTIAEEGTGWRLNIQELPYNTPVVVKYSCIVSEYINGMEIINTASACADNGKKVKGSTKIWINSPELKISRKSDKNSCKSGDTITYKFNLSQTAAGCVSRNASAEVLVPDGTKLREESVKVFDSQERKVTCDVQVTGNNFMIRTGRDLVKEEYYSVLNAEQEETVQQSMWNPLNKKEDTALTVEYQVTVTDAALAEREITNHVTVNSDENSPKEDKEMLQVNTPVLEVEMKTDKQSYAVGETAFYTLAVRQTVKDSVACDIIISDEFLIEGMTIVGDSPRVRINGAVVEAENIEADQRHLTIHTGKSLSEGDRMEISYQVVFDNPKLEGKTIVSWAEVKGSGIDAVNTEEAIHIGKKKADTVGISAKKHDDDNEKTQKREKEDIASDVSTKSSKTGKENAASETEDSSKAALFFILVAGGVLTSAGNLFRRLRRLRKYSR